VPRGRDAQARVSVVIPVWDEYAGDGLVQAVVSVRRQRVPVRLIVVDNASAVPLPGLEDVELVRLEQRRSTGAARNASLPLLRTEYVVFLDADDRLLDGSLAALIAGLDADPRRATHTLSIIDAAKGAPHRTPRRVARTLAAAPPLFALANVIWSLLPTQGCTIMRVPDVVESGGYADASTGEDWVLAVSLSFRGRQSFEQRPGLLYRQSARSPGVRALPRSTLLRNAARVRDRIATDPRAPRHLESLLPAISAIQWSAALLAHPVYRSARAALKRR
jgi:glycosyltransferase involved in cell wall biosynthesis